jgi:hypothetical protein
MAFESINVFTESRIRSWFAPEVIGASIYLLSWIVRDRKNKVLPFDIRTENFRSYFKDGSIQS